MRGLARALSVLGAVALFFGLIAGLVNRQLIDTDHFVVHADAVRTDPEVSRRLAIELSDRIIAAEPDVVFAKPLLEATLQATIRSAAFAPAFRAMAAPLHQTLVGRNTDTILFRLADVGAVLTAAARTVSPEAARVIPPDLDVRLAAIGSNGLGGRTIAHVDDVRTLAWLLPIVAVLCFAAAVVLSRRRRLDAAHGVGLAVLAVGVVLAVGTLVGTFVADRFAPDTLGGAVLAAAWHNLTGAVLTTAVVTGAAGYLVVVGTRLAAEGSHALTAMPTSLLSWLRGDSGLSPGAAVARATVLIGAGVLLVLDPAMALRLLGIGLGILLVVRGAVAGAVAVPALFRTRADSDERPRRRLWDSATFRTGLAAATAAVLAVCLAAGLVVWNSRESTSGRSLTSGSSSACNGAVELCNRPYNEVAFPATHNSMSAADQPGWFLAEQPNGIIAQLNAGIRVFLIDTWYGQATDRKGVVANTDATYEKAFAEAKATYGPEVLDSALRLRNALNLTPRGPKHVYLCHALCVLGATRWEPLMERVRKWLSAHPREVVTFFVQDATSPASTARVVKEAGLLPFVYTPTPEEAATKTWPTLAQMIDSGHRVVFLAERTGGGTTYPWLLPGFVWVQDTPFDARKVADFSCRLNRGLPTARLLLVNHWLNQPLSRVSSSARANSAAILGKRLDACEQQRDTLPNYVAVDHYDKGDLFGEVDRINGLG